MYGRDNRRNFAPPVQVGEELEVDIEAVGEKGDGIAKKDGFVLFVPGVKEGDHVKVKVTKVLRKVGFAEVSGEGEASADAASEDNAQAPAEDSQEPMPAEEATQAAAAEVAAEDSEDFGEEEAPAEDAEVDVPEVPEPEEAPAEDAEESSE